MAEVGPRPSVGYSLDRYPDPAGNYEPGNCRWATQKEQGKNRRSPKNRPRGEVKLLKQARNLLFVDNIKRVPKEEREADFLKHYGHLLGPYPTQYDKRVTNIATKSRCARDTALKTKEI